MPLAEISYRFLLRNMALTELVIGPKNISQLEMAIKYIDKGSLEENLHQEVYELISKNPIAAW